MPGRLSLSESSRNFHTSFTTCLDLATANDLASWLSKQAGNRYRVPTRAELSAVISNVEIAPVYAWTSTCNEVRVAQPRNVASRTWSGVRKIFG